MRLLAVLTVLVPVFYSQAAIICSTDFTSTEDESWTEGGHVRASSEWGGSATVDTFDVAANGFIRNEDTRGRSVYLQDGSAFTIGDSWSFKVAVSRTNLAEDQEALSIGISGARSGGSSVVDAGITLWAELGGCWALNKVGNSSATAAGTYVSSIAAETNAYSEVSVLITKSLAPNEFEITATIAGDGGTDFSYTVTNAALYADDEVFAALTLGSKDGVHAKVDSFRVDPDWDGLRANVAEKRMILEELINDAETAGLATGYAQVSLRVIKDFEFFSQYEYEHTAELEGVYDISWKDRIPESHLPQMLPFTELKQAIDVADYAIAELQKQLASEIILKPTVDFGTGNMTIANGRYRRNGAPVFPSELGPRDEEHLQAYGYMGGMNYSLRNLASDGFITQPPSRSFLYWRLNKVNEQLALHMSFPILFIGHGSVSSWMQESHPEVLDGGRNFVGYDTDSPIIRQWLSNLFEGFLPQICSAYGDGHHVHMLANEPNFATREGGWLASNGVSTHTMERYREWLVEKYESIEHLNAAYGTGHTGFDEARDAMVIPVPVDLQGGAIWYDWCRFNMHRINDFFLFLKNGTQSNDPYSGPVTVKLLGYQLVSQYRDEGMDMECLVDLMDVTGADTRCTPAGATYLINYTPEWETYYSFHWTQQSIMLDFCKSLHPDKPFLDGEWHGFSTQSWRDFSMDRDYVRAALWMAFSHGMNGISPWAWRRGSDGSLSSADTIGSLVTQPAALDAFGRVMKELNAHGNAVVALAEEERQFYIYYCEDAAIQSPSYVGEMAKIYEALKLLNVRVGFTTPSKIGSLDESKTVVVPPTLFISDPGLAALQGFAGDAVLVEGATAGFSKTEHGVNRGIPVISNYAAVPFNDDRELLADSLESVVNALKLTLPVQVTITDEHGSPERGVIVQQSTDTNGVTVVSLINTRSIPLTITIAEHGRELYYRDLISGKVIDRTEVMQPYDTMLLMTLSGWENYVETHGLTGDPIADTDDDGLNDLVEFAVNGDPWMADASSGVSFDIDHELSKVNFGYERYGYSNSGVSYIPEWSTNLSTWNSNWSGINISPKSTGDYESVEHIFNTTGKDRAFFRLRAERAE